MKLRDIYNNDIRPVAPVNIINKLREAFEVYPSDTWISSCAPGDIVQVEGNCAAASYLAISLDPTSIGTETTVESRALFNMPIDVALGVHTSQRTVGQEFSCEIVSDEELLPDYLDVQISSIQQATTTLTVNTVTPHNLVPGMRVGIRDCSSDSRLNYPALVVASIPTTTQFTATAGPAGTIPSLTVGPFTSGYVYFRTALGRAQNGTSIILENATPTNASFYARSEAGDVLPSGTIIANHSVTILTTASVQAINAANSYSFQPTDEFRLAMSVDNIQWSDLAVDAVVAPNNRYKRTQVIPNYDTQYKLRFRAVNRPSLTRPVAKIVSAAKSGTTTATIITDVAHGLTVGDYVNTYGVRDQTNFANLSAATVVASVVNATTFTIIWGSAVTATSYGGYVARVNGGNLMQGAVVQSCQSVTRTSNVVSLTGSANWAGVLIGDLVNLHGCRDNSNGADIGIDGPYRIANIASAVLTLVPIGSTPTGVDIGATNCGGAIIRRTDLRISYARIFDFERLRIEHSVKPSGDAAVGIPVCVQNPVGVSGTLTGNQGTRGTVGAGWYVEPDNLLVNDVTSAAITTTTTTTAISPTPAGAASEFNVIVTAVSGTTPTLDIGIEESDDNGTNWYRIYDFPRITAAGAYRSPVLPLSGNRLRYVQTIGGTSPSFTRAVNRITHQMVTPPCMRQIIDRTVAPNTLNSTTPTLKTNCTTNMQMVVNMGAITTTAPVFQLEGSDDNGATWYSIGSPLTAVASSTVQLTSVDINSDLLRARVSTAGSGATLGSVTIKAFG
jgi:hypothetical protein